MNELVDKEKRQIRALLQSVKFGLSADQLWKDYRKMIGTHCDYRRFGFNTFNEFLEGMPDTVRFSNVRGQTVVVAVATHETKHISRMVASQKTQSVSYGKRSMLSAKDRYSIKPVPLDLQGKLKRLMIPYSHGLPLSQLPKEFSEKYGFNILPEKFGYENMVDFVSKGSQVLKLVPGERGATQLVKVIENPSYLDLGGDVRAYGHQSSRIQSAEERKSTSYKPTYRSSYSSMPGFGRSVSTSTGNDDVFSSSVRTVSLNDIDTSPIATAKPSLGDQKPAASMHERMEEPKPIVPDDLRGVLWRLLRQHPNGVPLKLLPHFYKRYAHEEFPLYGLGFESYDEMVTSIPNVCTIERSAKEVLLFPVPTSPTPVHTLEDLFVLDPKERSMYQRKESSTSSASSTIVTVSYVRAEWPKQTPVNVTITHVEDPGHFYVQLMDERRTEELASLQEDLLMFYQDSRKAEKYHISSARKGQPCIAMFPEDRLWYRAEVLGLPEEGSVEVKYVDFGNTAIVSRDFVKRAKAHYLTLPVHAIQCATAKLIPKGSQIWSQAATRYFKEQCEGKSMVAFVKSDIDSLQSSSGPTERLALSLCDTSTDDDIYINDEMVKRHYAQIDSSPAVKPSSKKPSQPQSHLPQSVPSALAPPGMNGGISGLANSGIGGQRPTGDASSFASSHLYHPSGLGFQVPQAPLLPMTGECQVPANMVPPQLWSSYMAQLAALQHRPTLHQPQLPPFFLHQQQQQQMANSFHMPTPSPASLPMYGMGIGVGSSMPMPGSAAGVVQASGGGQPSPLGPAHSAPTNGTTSLQAELVALREQRKQMVQRMSVLSQTSSGLGSCIDMLSAIETKIRSLEQQVSFLNAFQSMVVTDETQQQAAKGSEEGEKMKAELSKNPGEYGSEMVKSAQQPGSRLSSLEVPPVQSLFKSPSPGEEIANSVAQYCLPTSEHAVSSPGLQPPRTAVTTSQVNSLSSQSTFYPSYQPETVSTSFSKPRGSQDGPKRENGNNQFKAEEDELSLSPESNVEQFLSTPPPLSPFSRSGGNSPWQNWALPSPQNNVLPGGRGVSIAGKSRNPAVGLGRGTSIASLFSQAV